MTKQYVANDEDKSDKERRWFPRRTAIFEITFRSSLLDKDAEAYIDYWATTVSGDAPQMKPQYVQERVSNWQGHLNTRKAELKRSQEHARTAGDHINLMEEYDAYVSYANKRGFSSQHIKAQLVSIFGDQLPLLQGKAQRRRR